MKKSIIGLIILALLWTGNIYYYHVNQLNKLVFMEHYSKRNLYDWDSAHISLFYLANKEEHIGISSISIPGYDRYLTFYPENVVGTYQYQEMREIRVELDVPHWRKELSGEDLIINELTVHFSNGNSEQVPIGELHYVLETKGEGFRLSTSSVSSSSDNTGYASFHLDETITIKDFQIPFTDHLKEALTVELNGEEIRDNNLFPLTLDRRDPFRVSYALAFEEGDKNAYHYYDVDFPFWIETEDGEEKMASFSIIYRPEFSEKKIRALVAERRQQ